MLGIIIKYSDYYNKVIPKNPLDLLSHIPKEEIIVVIAKINTLLQPLGYRSHDDSREKQIECMRSILLPDEKNLTPYNLQRYARYDNYLSKLPDRYSIFTRGGCLYALNEVLQSDSFFKGDKTQYTFDERIGILDYLLACNERILDFSFDKTYEELKKDGVNFFEFFAFNQTPYNQYNITINSLAKLYKSSFFLKSLIKNDLTKEPLKNYFRTKYGLDDIEEFFRVFMFTLMKMYDENLKVYHLKIAIEHKSIINIFKGFSSATFLTTVDHSDIKTLDFLPIKKNPMYNWEPLSPNEYSGFVVLDLAFLLEKIDSLFINDFWFDYLKEKSDLNRIDWGNFIGSKFFEPLVGDIISNTFRDKKDYEVKMFDELKIKISPKREIEIADVYIRHRQKIAFVEVKSNFINMIDGYKSVANVDEFKALDREKFYKTFGLNQLVSTIKNFHIYKHYLNDENLNLTRKVHLHPIILVNEPIISSGLFNYPLREKFEAMLITENITLKSKEHIIWPLIIINIEELQELEQSIFDDDISFFGILDSFYSKTEVKSKHGKDKYKSLITIHNIINEKISGKKLLPDRLKDYKWVSESNL